MNRLGYALVAGIVLLGTNCGPSRPSGSGATRSAAVHLRTGFGAALSVARATGGFTLDGTGTYEGERMSVTERFSLRMDPGGSFLVERFVTDSIGDTESFTAIYDAKKRRVCVAEGPRPYVCKDRPERETLDYLVGSVWKVWSDAVQMMGLPASSCKNGCSSDAGTLTVRDGIPHATTFDGTHRGIRVRLGATLSRGRITVSLPPSSRIYGNAERHRILMDRKRLLGDHRPAPLRYLYPR